MTKRETNKWGFSTVEALVSVAVLGIAAAGLFETIEYVQTQSRQSNASTEVMMYEALLRGQIQTKARSRLDVLERSPNQIRSYVCESRLFKKLDLLHGWDVPGATGPRFAFAMPPPGENLRALDVHRLITAASKMKRQAESGPADSLEIFSAHRLLECAQEVVDAMDAIRSGRTLNGSNCKSLVDYEGYEYKTVYKRFILAKLKATLFDFTNLRPVACSEADTIKKPGIRVVYSLIWNIGTESEPIATTKSGVLDIGGLD